MVIPPFNISISFDFSKTTNNFNLTEVKEPELKELQSSVQKALEIDAKDKVNVRDKVSLITGTTATISSFRPTGSLTMTKHTNNPTEDELKLIQLARGNRPYNSITDIHIDYDEKGNTTGISWTES